MRCDSMISLRLSTSVPSKSKTMSFTAGEFRCADEPNSYPVTGSVASHAVERRQIDSRHIPWALEALAPMPDGACRLELEEFTARGKGRPRAKACCGHFPAGARFPH